MRNRIKCKKIIGWKFNFVAFKVLICFFAMILGQLMFQNMRQLAYRVNFYIKRECGTPRSILFRVKSLSWHVKISKTTFYCYRKIHANFEDHLTSNLKSGRKNTQNSRSVRAFGANGTASNYPNIHFSAT